MVLRCGAGFWIACAVLSWLLASAASANEFEDFEKARAVYEGQDYARAAQLFEALAGGDVPQLTNRSLVLESKKYLGASHLFLGKLERAEQEFTRLLRMDPAYLLDPLAFPEEVQRLFAKVKLQLEAERRAAEEVRRREEQRALRQQTERIELERLRWEQLQALAQVEIVREERSRWLALVPFGAGQFQNGHASLGAVLAVSEGSLLALAMVTYALHESLRGQAPTEVDDARLAERAFRYTNQISFALFAILAVTGVIDAQVRFQATREYERKRPLPPGLEGGPELSLDPAAGSLRLRF
jgi:tetratricopeptide (TPR) repeat protein